MNEQKIFSWMNPKLDVRLTTKYGTGDFPIKSDGGEITYHKRDGDGFAVFCKEEIMKDTVLVVMGGYILTIDDENKLEGVVADKPIELSKDFSIGPRTGSDIALMPQHYINHSCDPNAGFDGQIFLVAMRDINADEEITYDYAMVMQPNEDSNSYFQFECRCGSDQCRKVIQENDSLNVELQKKYDGYFQHSIQKKINRLRK